MMEARLQLILIDYPKLQYAKLSKTSNIALSQFLMMKIDNTSREQLRASVDDQNDGIAILLVLQRSFGGMNVTDASKALERLNNTSWEPNDTIGMFNSRFLQRVNTYHTTIASSAASSHQKLSKLQQLITYLKQLT